MALLVVLQPITAETVAVLVGPELLLEPLKLGDFHRVQVLDRMLLLLVILLAVAEAP